MSLDILSTPPPRIHLAQLNKVLYGGMISMVSNKYLVSALFMPERQPDLRAGVIIKLRPSLSIVAPRIVYSSYCTQLALPSPQVFNYPNTGAVQSCLRTPEVTCRERGKEGQLPPVQLDIILFSPLLHRLSLSHYGSLFTLLLDSITVFLAYLVTLSLERLVSTGGTKQFLAAVYQGPTPCCWPR